MRDDRPANQFNDLGDDGVSEASKSVHPIGNPISHSGNVGLKRPLTAGCKCPCFSSALIATTDPRQGEARTRSPGQSSYLLALGVGHILSSAIVEASAVVIRPASS